MINAMEDYERVWMRKIIEIAKGGNMLKEKVVEWKREGLSERWFTDLFKQASAGDSDAQVALALSFLEYSRDSSNELSRTEIDEYEAMAFMLFKMGAAQSNSEAIRQMAIAYDCGYGCEINRWMSEGWYLRAAELGNYKAMKALSQLYACGWFETDDPMGRASEWEKKAARQRLDNLHKLEPEEYYSDKVQAEVQALYKQIHKEAKVRDDWTR